MIINSEVLDPVVHYSLHMDYLTALLHQHSVAGPREYGSKDHSGFIKGGVMLD